MGFSRLWDLVIGDDMNLVMRTRKRQPRIISNQLLIRKCNREKKRTYTNRKTM